MRPSKTGHTDKPVFKSWAEKQLALFLERHKIAYQYEYPLALVDSGRVRLYYPDFRLPQYGLIMEYFGMVGNPSYDEQVRHKLAVYRDAGIEGIFLTPESLRGYWPDRLWQQIDDHLKNRLEGFRTCQHNLPGQEF